MGHSTEINIRSDYFLRLIIGPSKAVENFQPKSFVNHKLFFSLKNAISKRKRTRERIWKFQTFITWTTHGFTWRWKQKIILNSNKLLASYANVNEIPISYPMTKIANLVFLTANEIMYRKKIEMMPKKCGHLTLKWNTIWAVVGYYSNVNMTWAILSFAFIAWP